ncbi:MAG: hypothetical protein ACPLPW_08110 [bacterium]
MKDKFPLKIIRNEEGTKFKAATSLDKLKAIQRNIRLELGFLEKYYLLLVQNAQNAIWDIKNSQRVDPRMYWTLGDFILRFLEIIEELGFYLWHQNWTLARDIGISESSIRKIIAFRRRFPKLSMVDPKIPWVKYRGNKVQIPIE